MARKTKMLSQRSKFIIITNGKESEKNYFEALRASHRSIFDIKVEFDNADPVSLVKRAIRENDRSNQVWIVFDKDEFPSAAVYDAIREAHKHRIGVAFSNAAFEVWLINHFRELRHEHTASELVKELDALLVREGYSKGYSKSDSEVFKKRFVSRIDDAIQSSKISLQKRKAEYDSAIHGSHSYPYCDWNPCTTVHELVEALNLEKKN